MVDRADDWRTQGSQKELSLTNTIIDASTKYTLDSVPQKTCSQVYSAVSSTKCKNELTKAYVGHLDEVVREYIGKQAHAT